MGTNVKIGFINFRKVTTTRQKDTRRLDWKPATAETLLDREVLGVIQPTLTRSGDIFLIHKVQIFFNHLDTHFLMMNISIKCFDVRDGIGALYLLVNHQLKSTKLPRQILSSKLVSLPLEIVSKCLAIEH